MAFTLTEVQTSFLNLKKDISDVSQQIFIEWNNFTARFIYRKLRATDPERFIDQSNTFSVSAMPQTSALPLDFRDINPEGCGFFEIDKDGKDTQRRLPPTGFGRMDQGYYISKGNVVFTGIEDGTQFRLRYIPELVDFTALGEYWTLDGLVTGVEIIPDEYRKYIVDAINVLYVQWDEDFTVEAIIDQRFVRALNEVIQEVRKEPDAHQIPDFSSSF